MEEMHKTKYGERGGELSCPLLAHHSPSKPTCFVPPEVTLGDLGAYPSHLINIPRTPFWFSSLRKFLGFKSSVLATGRPNIYLL